jgi:hypothetical protein
LSSVAPTPHSAEVGTDGAGDGTELAAAWAEALAA